LLLATTKYYGGLKERTKSGDAPVVVFRREREGERERRFKKE